MASYYELGETVFSMRGTGVDKAREDILRVGQAIQKIGQPGAGACMMELPMLPLPDLMAAKKTPAKNAVAKARKDLSKAAKVVHAKPERTYAPLIDLGQFSEGQLAELMVAAGDAPGGEPISTTPRSGPTCGTARGFIWTWDATPPCSTTATRTGRVWSERWSPCRPSSGSRFRTSPGKNSRFSPPRSLRWLPGLPGAQKSKRRLVVTTATDDWIQCGDRFGKPSWGGRGNNGSPRLVVNDRRPWAAFLWLAAGGKSNGKSG